jgi:hypothetical protein
MPLRRDLFLSLKTGTGNGIGCSTHQQLYTRRRVEIGASLAASEKQWTLLQTCFDKQHYNRMYFERASHIAHIVSYELKSLNPIATQGRPPLPFMRLFIWTT